MAALAGKSPPPSKIAPAAPRGRPPRGSRSRFLYGAVEGDVGQPGGLAHVGDLGRGLHRPQAGHEVRGLHQRAESIECGLHALEVEAGEAVSVGLDPKPFTPTPLLFEDLLEILGGIDAFGVVPEPDVRDHGGVLGLTQVGGAGQEDEGLAVRPHVEALEEDVAEGVVPGEVVHRLLAEHEQAVEATPGQLGGHLSAKCMAIALAP
jgi:hypothetical protein